DLSKGGSKLVTGFEARQHRSLAIPARVPWALLCASGPPHRRAFSNGMAAGARTLKAASDHQRLTWPLLLESARSRPDTHGVISDVSLHSRGREFAAPSLPTRS